MSPSGKAAYYNDVRAVKLLNQRKLKPSVKAERLFKSNIVDVILLGSYNNSLECLEMIKEMGIDMDVVSRPEYRLKLNPYYFR